MKLTEWLLANAKGNMIEEGLKEHALFDGDTTLEHTSVF